MRSASAALPAAKRAKQRRITKRRENAIRSRLDAFSHPGIRSPQALFEALGRVRSEAEQAVERLIAFLDALNEPDLEADADLEPTLGSAQEFATADQRDWTTPDVDEREGDDPDFEPSLGWTTCGSTGGNDQDLEDEHDGAEPDDDAEPLLGAVEGQADQDVAWAPVPARFDFLAHDGEADELDAGEYDPAESGIGDADGALEQTGMTGRGEGASGCPSHVE